MNQYMRHNPDGEVYAVQLEEGKQVISACGPLHHSEVTQENIKSYNFDSEMELVEWIQEHLDEFQSVSQILEGED